MNKYLLFLLLVVFTKSGKAQLPAVAQALYDEAWQQDSLIVQYAINNGAQIIATDDGNSFYVQWFPSGAQAANTPVIVTLHGSNGFAFHEFFYWHAQAVAHNCGIIALQWYRGASTSPPNDYFNDAVIYAYLDSALNAVNYPAGKAFYHGFSRASARSYAVIFNDIQSGKNYFCTELSNAGAVDLNYPLYNQINSGVYGASPFAGKHFNLFCGGQDTAYNQSGCPGMTNTKNWLQSKGAVVDIFIQDPNLDHGGFHTVTAYMDSVLNKYLECYGAVVLKDEIRLIKTSVFPNPCKEMLSIKFDRLPEMDTEIIFYSVTGKFLFKFRIDSPENLIPIQLEPGMYIYKIETKGEIITAGKICKE